MVSLIGFLAVITLKDFKPDLEKFKKLRLDKNQKLGNVKFLLKRAWDTTMSDITYIYLFFCGGAINIMLLCFSNYLVMWITSFVESGIVSDDE